MSKHPGSTLSRWLCHLRSCCLILCCGFWISHVFSARHDVTGAANGETQIWSILHLRWRAAGSVAAFAPVCVRSGSSCVCCRDWGGCTWFHYCLRFSCSSCCFILSCHYRDVPPPSFSLSSSSSFFVLLHYSSFFIFPPSSSSFSSSSSFFFFLLSSFFFLFFFLLSLLFLFSSFFFFL